jgi:Ala-tRNA(Pro) deacylase
LAGLALPVDGPHRAPHRAAFAIDPRRAVCAPRCPRDCASEYSHPPVFTVAEATALRGSLPGGHCKSLFLKDKKGGFWLTVLLEERRLDLKKLASRLPAPRFSFGAAADLYRLLGVRPGSVTPFALVNDVEHCVTPVLEAAMLDHDPLNYHPLANDRTTAVAPADLLRFIAACGHEPRIIDLAGFEREPAVAAG